MANFCAMVDIVNTRKRNIKACWREVVFINKTRVFHSDGAVVSVNLQSGRAGVKTME